MKGYIYIYFIAKILKDKFVKILKIYYLSTGHATLRIRLAAFVSLDFFFTHC